MSAEPIVGTDTALESEITVLFDRVLVKRLEAAETFKPGGVIVQADVHKQKPQEGIVLSVGPQCEQVKTGQHVLFGKHSGVEVELIEGETVFILREQEIMGVRKP